jgi:hypothetical protein
VALGTKNDCADEGQQQCTRQGGPLLSVDCHVRWSRQVCARTSSCQTVHTTSPSGGCLHTFPCTTTQRCCCVSRPRTTSTMGHTTHSAMMVSIYTTSSKSNRPCTPPTACLLVHNATSRIQTAILSLPGINRLTVTMSRHAAPVVIHCVYSTALPDATALTATARPWAHDLV